MVQPSDSKSAEPEAKATPEAMTKMSSASGAADKDTVIEAMPYGTRSRNRTANSRPNYAEDKDIEMDIILADHVYLVCEPPGEPYYLGRIMEFMHTNNDASRPVDAVRINWYYRPKDIGRKASDTRMVFASMHSDISPLTALRGKCQIRHRLEIKSMDDYRRTPDSFWYEKLYDRYIQKNYDLIPTRLIVNVPEKVKKVLDERWQYVLVEQGRGKELTSAVKLCKRCSGYCARYVPSTRPYKAPHLA
ncbi:hypothetical protein ACSS6W_003404 [Trichoderma asperelloides]